ncbi:hypothetical protein SAMN05720473_11111 [Fibrobacter sp. UWB15]|nr:hypothetical protein BGW99_11210 [Fibrobacter sp. UWB6]SHG52453.1 hypothetical protein SAMN05720760_11363 [Fibrobacter sp. UWB8]SMG40394.1 hypothetical protein SAMN05720473_11111 [Fibrobacter sp. UWB15]
MSGRIGFVVCLTLLVSVGYAEEKSMWTKFVEFFSPSSTVEGEGPLYDQVRELDRKINRVEGKYARERRPMTKDRYKKELVQLREEREALMKKIEAEEKNKGKSSAVAKSSSSVKAAVSSSSAAKSSSSVESVTVAVEGCKPDTVYVRDTVVVHDTLYVMLAPKPEAAPADTSKK